MITYKILIADDEQEARDLIHYYLNKATEEFSIQQATNGSEAIFQIKAFKPDIIFMDIKMPEASGLEVLEISHLDHQPAIIFSTAYDEFALSAFDFDAVDYLVKPFDKERFDRALNRAKEYVGFIKNKNLINKVKTISIKQGVETLFIPVNEILYFQAEGTYVRVITENKQYLISEPIYKLEASLNHDTFLRIHRSVIVNSKYIKSIRTLPNADHIVMLSNGVGLRSSRTFKDNIKNKKFDSY